MITSTRRVLACLRPANVHINCSRSMQVIKLRAVLREVWGPSPHSKVCPPSPPKWSSPRRYFNRSICYCITRIAGVSLSIVNCATHLSPWLFIALPPVLALLEPPLDKTPDCRVIHYDKNNELPATGLTVNLTKKSSHTDINCNLCHFFSSVRSFVRSFIYFRHHGHYSPRR